MLSTPLICASIGEATESAASSNLRRVGRRHRDLDRRDRRVLLDRQHVHRDEAAEAHDRNDRSDRRSMKKRENIRVRLLAYGDFDAGLASLPGRSRPAVA
jgi:hypothetical protein